MEFKILIEKLIHKKISIYKAIDTIKRYPDRYVCELRKTLFVKIPYLRLFSAWALGEIKDNESIKLLLKKYNEEKDKNVRANIVRALFFINPVVISFEEYTKFLNDSYDLIPMITLKFLCFCRQAHFKLQFEYYFEHIKDEIAKIELLKNIRFFLYKNESIGSFLYKNLIKTRSLSLRVQLIESIALINEPSSLTVLIRYYQKRKVEFEKNSALAMAFINSVITLCQSKAYAILYNLYLYHNAQYIRLKIIEALANGGGPNSLKVLHLIYKNECDQRLRKEIIRKIKSISVLDIKNN